MGSHLVVAAAPEVYVLTHTLGGAVLLGERLFDNLGRSLD
jgi:hypothetical protein